MDEIIREVEATMALEGIELTKEDIHLLQVIREGKISGNELRQQILENVREGVIISRE